MGTAQHLLAQLHAAEVAPCLLLFTTRPITWMSDERSLWSPVTRIPVSRFTEEELKEALDLLPSPVSRDELPKGLVEVAKIPRYFRRAIELRERFKSLANVSKEMVLWADLLAKVQAGDPQITTQIGWTSPADVKRALLKLASAARAVQTNAQTTTDSYSLLQSCFGDKFERIRSDLAEQRVLLEPTSENPTPSAEHLVLGFALHLGLIAAKPATDLVSDLADRLRKELEPVLSQDQLTEALFVALQLSAFPHAEGHILSSRARSALLLAWASSQNSLVEAPRLMFWAHQDLVAYLDFVEEVFVEPVSDGWSSMIIAPIMEVWRSSTLEQSTLDARLRRWLKLIWKSHDLPKGAETVVDNHVLPIARSGSQLALSIVALAVLAERPAESFLSDLAIAWATAALSTQRHIFKQQPTSPIEETHEFHCKDLDYNLGAILRWRYTETARPRIELLKAGCTADLIMAKGLGYMIETFDKFGWTRGSIPEQRLRNREPMFPKIPEEYKNRIADCPELAVRDDFPDLCEHDYAVIAQKVEQVFSSQNLHSSRTSTRNDSELKYHLSWFARKNAQRLAELGAHFRVSLLNFPDAGVALHFANLLPYPKPIRCHPRVNSLAESPSRFIS